MKKLSIWSVILLTLVFGFNSCEETEDIDTCPTVDITIDNEPGSLVYRFTAQLDSIQETAFIWSVDGVAIDTTNLGAITGRLLNYQFEEGKHTVCVKLADTNCPVQVCKDIDVKRDDTAACPDLFFESRTYESESQYKFIADFEGIETVDYDWYINGELVDEDGDWKSNKESNKESEPDDEHYLIWQFEEAGRYEVCIKAETETCPEGVSYCEVIEIEEVDAMCPEVYIEKEIIDTDATYEFEAVVEDAEVYEIAWYINDQFIGSDETLTYQFEEGVHEVCLKVFTEDCKEGVVYCKEIEVEDEDTDGCPELVFEAEQDGDNLAYYFHPELSDTVSSDVVLDWTVNDDYVQSTTANDPTFYYQFDKGTYEICVLVETPECPYGASFCKTIEIQ